MRGRGPSPAVLVAVLALVAALGGTALAGSIGSAKKKHGDAKADTRLFKKLLKKAAPKLTVKQAGTATSAKTAGSAAHATNSDKLGGTGASGFKQRVAKPGELQTGIFEADGTGGPGNDEYSSSAIQFDPPLAADLCVNNCSTHTGYVINTPSPSCPATGQAARGVLCLYQTGVDGMTFANSDADPQTSGTGIRKIGSVAYFNTPTAAGVVGYIRGVWAMRAP
jgi:hypothetical protein